MLETLDQLLRQGPDFALKFIVAVICGGAIGMERETTGKPAGLRTSILVCAGSTIFTIMSIDMGKAYDGDGTRIAAQIVTGIGFLGAGVILHTKGGIKGVTTAAMIWLLAGLGLMIGAGYLFSAIGLTVATVVMILVLARVEDFIHRRRGRSMAFALEPSSLTIRQFLAAVHAHEDSIDDFSINDDDRPPVARLTFVGSHNDRLEFLHSIGAIDGVRRVKTGTSGDGLLTADDGG